MRPRTLLTGSELKSSPNMSDRTHVYILQDARAQQKHALSDLVRQSKEILAACGQKQHV